MHTRSAAVLLWACWLAVSHGALWQSQGAFRSGVRRCASASMCGLVAVLDSKLSAPALLHNLRVRYSRDEIYTRVGAILISVNPFKQLTIHTPEKMREAKASAMPWPPPCSPRASILRTKSSLLSLLS